ncbi:hypothetical protein Tco_1193001, partial [Tanacetum coccineum]
FILDGEEPSTTDVGPKKKTIKGKGKQDDTPLGPNKKGFSSGGRGRPKPLAPDECPWAVQITKVKNSETWEVRTYNEEHKCLQSRKIIACTHKLVPADYVPAGHVLISADRYRESADLNYRRDYCN